MAAVGVDISPLAVALARGRGATVIEGSIFDCLPGAGEWGSALLLDGNIGIGGVPEQLLARIGGLLRPDGLILVEAETPGVRTQALNLSLQTSEARSQWFPWARVGIDSLSAIAATAGAWWSSAGMRATVGSRPSCGVDSAFRNRDLPGPALDHLL